MDGDHLNATRCKHIDVPYGAFARLSRRPLPSRTAPCPKLSDAIGQLCDKVMERLACTLVFAAVLFTTPLPVVAASFDCSKATTAVETLICRDPELSELDQAMANAYADALADRKVRHRPGSSSPLQVADLIKKQRAWLRSRSETCGIPSAGGANPSGFSDATHCLVRMYRQRTAELGLRYGRIEAPGGGKPNNKIYSYDIIFDSGDSICRDLSQFYTEMIRSGKHIGEAVWEISNAKKLKQLGLVDLNHVKEISYGLNIYSDDIFGDGTPRFAVRLQSYGWGPSYRQTHTYVLKKDATLDTFLTPNRPGASFNEDLVERLNLVPEFPDSALSDHPDFFDPLPLVAHHMVKFPHFADFYKILTQDKLKPITLPGVEYVDHTFLYKYKGSHLFITRGHVNFNPLYEDNGEIIVSIIRSSSSRDDICYLIKSPGNFLIKQSLMNEYLK